MDYVTELQFCIETFLHGLRNCSSAHGSFYTVYTTAVLHRHVSTRTTQLQFHPEKFLHGLHNCTLQFCTEMFLYWLRKSSFVQGSFYVDYTSAVPHREVSTWTIQLQFHAGKFLHGLHNCSSTQGRFYTDCSSIQRRFYMDLRNCSSAQGSFSMDYTT